MKEMSFPETPTNDSVSWNTSHIMLSHLLIVIHCLHLIGLLSFLCVVIVYPAYREDSRSRRRHKSRRNRSHDRDRSTDRKSSRHESRSSRHRDRDIRTKELQPIPDRVERTDRDKKRKSRKRRHSPSNHRSGKSSSEEMGRDHRGQRWKKRKLNGSEPSGPASSGSDRSVHSVHQDASDRLKGNNGFSDEIEQNVTFDRSNPVKDIKNLVSNSKSNIARIPAVLQDTNSGKDSRHAASSVALATGSTVTGNVSSLVKNLLTLSLQLTSFTSVHMLRSVASAQLCTLTLCELVINVMSLWSDQMIVFLVEYDEYDDVHTVALQSHYEPNSKIYSLSPNRWQINHKNKWYRQCRR